MTISHKGRVPKDMEKKKMNTNPPSYVRIRPIIKRCQGCRVPFDSSDRIAPHDLVFRYVQELSNINETHINIFGANLEGGDLVRRTKTRD